MSLQKIYYYILASRLWYMVTEKNLKAHSKNGREKYSIDTIRSHSKNMKLKIKSVDRQICIYTKLISTTVFLKRGQVVSLWVDAAAAWQKTNSIQIMNTNEAWESFRHGKAAPRPDACRRQSGGSFVRPVILYGSRIVLLLLWRLMPVAAASYRLDPCCSIYPSKY